MDQSLRTRARGAMYGQIIGDNLGAIVEFSSPAQIRSRFPDGVRELTGGGPFNVAPGQATDDSELALALARSMVRCGGYEEKDVFESYVRWAASFPPDIGNTCAAALRPPFAPNAVSKSNGALMRVSPIAIAYAHDPQLAGDHARTDARLTHPNEYPVVINGMYCEALARTISGEDPREALLAAAGDEASTIREFMQHLPVDVYSHRMGYVQFAWNIVCYFVANGASFEEDLVAIVGMGGDTDTNAAIAGAFLGAVYGEEGIPRRWRQIIDAYSTHKANRPEEFSVEGALDLVDALLS
ncbi:ADP-ribosylglycohydrolase family protein [Corynebacterium sp. MC-17D]|uniref:ADP-ribosylglycohydrolase family protein n=1 Tax=Corynebacterium lipophilum TaxID=2804918 RepID=A0AAW5I081_9CORY|nr:ADP-ribosylglycohydrolase family protein [Corynebacterium lipophilum]MCO6395491.1 ADP-ribosylglycohydrolase family protein [Corynebacterium lipophilum]MCZ2118208.1 ADP-ribosylglycohydrolase family protein [Corynebacterium lipophilum]